METIVQDDERRKKVCDLLIVNIESDPNFNMGFWCKKKPVETGCKTVRCIGGWLETLVLNRTIKISGEVIQQLMLNNESSKNQLDMELLQYWLTGVDDVDHTESLFQPEIENEDGDFIDYSMFSKEEALKTLRHFRETGIVNWIL